MGIGQKERKRTKEINPKTAAAMVATNGVAGFTNDVGELEWTIYQAKNSAETNENRRQQFEV